MDTQFEETGLWRDTLAVPEAVARTLDNAAGFSEVASLLKRPGLKRVVVTGNGASYYVAQALWLASLRQPRSRVDVVAVPGGLLAGGRFPWRDGDVMMGISSSGRFRDLIEAVESDTFVVPYGLVTADPDSTLARVADAVAVVEVPSQLAVTHTQAFCGAVAAVLAIWASATGDTDLHSAVAGAADASSQAIEATLAWAKARLPEVESPNAAAVIGTGEAWAAALENALVMKEVARIPCEGVETREGATSVATALMSPNLVLSLPTRDDSLIVEAEQICARRGAQVLRAPGGDLAPPSVSAITTFPASVAVAAELARRSGWDVDNPDWIDTYYTTARATA